MRWKCPSILWVPVGARSRVLQCCSQSILRWKHFYLLAASLGFRCAAEYFYPGNLCVTWILGLTMFWWCNIRERAASLMRQLSQGTHTAIMMGLMVLRLNQARTDHHCLAETCRISLKCNKAYYSQENGSGGRFIFNLQRKSAGENNYQINCSWHNQMTEVVFAIRK